jgi:hypothetical protein
LRCCNGCTYVLQMSVTNVSSVFSDVCCRCVYVDAAYMFHTYVAGVFIWILRTFAIVFQVF